MDSMPPRTVERRELCDLTSDDTSSASESSREQERDAAPVAQKKRKATYYQRKDEIEVLQDELTKLREELALAKSRQAAVPPSGAALAALCANDIERNNLALAGTQSMLSAYHLSLTSGLVPLNTFIHLPVDPDARTAALNAMRTSKLCAGYRFIRERTRFLDLRQTHCQQDSLFLANGDFVTTVFDVNHFDQGHSLQQVFDELMYFISHQEMSVSEKMGVLTIRESEESDEFKNLQTRLLATLPEGLEVESNGAMFSTGVVIPPAHTGEPRYALGVIDFVDQDDLYPYRPETCGRKDITGVIMMTPLSTPSGEEIIAMCTWTYVRFYKPTFPVPKAAEEGVRQNMLDWRDVIPKVMKERLALRTPDPS